MCSRPAQASQVIECPECHKKYPIVGGIKQKSCPMCGCDLTDVKPSTAGPGGAGPGAGAGGAGPKGPAGPPAGPKAPGAPGAPKAPPAPPKAPGA
ncbi:MAG: hypothetical protein AB2L09_11095 [Coriobacteriia bacterium]